MNGADVLDACNLNCVYITRAAGNDPLRRWVVTICFIYLEDRDWFASPALCIFVRWDTSIYVDISIYEYMQEDSVRAFLRAIT